MRIILKYVIEKVCCNNMQEYLDKGLITHHVLQPNLKGHNYYNFYLGDKVIFYCPWCGEECY